ncbi:MAG: phasin family protein [Rhodospirillales bacterium]|nr:phasin family protein [Rhodospirillales bacterium]
MTTAKAKTADTTNHIEDAVAVGQETIDTVVKASTDVANKGYEKAVALTKEHVESAVKAGNAAFKGYEDVVRFNKDNVDAILKSGVVVAKGVQDVGRTLITIAQGNIDDGMAAGKALAGAKTLKDLLDVQSSLAKSSFDKFFSESARLSQITVKLAEEAMAPLNSRLSQAVDKLLRPVV